MIRVLARYLNLKDDFRIEKNRKNLDIINQDYINHATPKVYTQAMMELGATVCRPKNPKCEQCPLNEHCIAYELNIQVELPFLSKLKDKVEFHYITLKIRDKNGNIYLRKRTENLLEGMYEYPQFESESIRNVISLIEEKDIYINVLSQEKTYKHVFTHQVWYMDVYEVSLIRGVDKQWIQATKDELQNLPMAIAHRKIK